MQFEGGLEVVHKLKASDFNTKMAEYLKSQKNIALPPNSDIIKTCHAKQRSPSDPDWYYKRAASIIRSLALSEEGCSVKFFARKFGCSKNNGVRPSHHANASSGLIRRILKSLEGINWVEKKEGRVLSEEGKKEIKQFIEKVTQ